MSPSQDSATFSIADHDAVGFDLDHTLCKYKLPALYKLIYESLVDFLIEKRNYSRNLHHFYAEEIDFMQKGLILDKERGNILKLGCDYTILRATHGTQIMSKEDICKIYGDNCVWDSLKCIPKRLSSGDTKAEPYFVFKDYFSVPAALLCARIVDNIDEHQKDSIPSAYSFWHDVYDALIFIYDRSGFENNTGKFFHTLKSDPSKFLKPCTATFKQWLKKLNETKTTFLLTSSNVDYASFLAEFTLGQEWKTYFNSIVTFARKPLFHVSNNPFFTIVGSREGNIISGDKLQPQVIYAQGNWKDFYGLLCQISNKTSPKVIYIGDSITDDVYTPSVFVQCNAIAIVEEIAAEGTSGLAVSYDAVKEVSSSLWGSFFGTTPNDKNSKVKTLWFDIISRHSKMAIPYVDVLSEVPLDYKFPAFTIKYDINGFYPSCPPSLTL